MRFKIPLCSRLRRNRRAVSPAISTVILTSAIVVLLLVTIVFANNFLTSRMTENEFSAMKQFMQTVGLQIDDVAWIPGRTQTIRYASRFGQVNFVNNTLVYSVYVNTGAGYVLLGNYTTGVLLFNMPISQYSVGNNYHERIFPTSGSFLNNGTSAPTSYVFVVEKLPMYDGDYIRVVVVPCIRMLNAKIGGTHYYKFYLPLLESQGNHPRRSQSVTLAGKSVSVNTKSGNAVKITVSFPNATQGFNADFFNFDGMEEAPPQFPPGSVIEFYAGKVEVSLGVHG
ncbi:MAG: hypothetical protein ACPLKQ_00840 [Candidatus Bathyarchaeales archaeon]